MLVGSIELNDHADGNRADSVQGTANMARLLGAAGTLFVIVYALQRFVVNY